MRYHNCTFHPNAKTDKSHQPSFPICDTKSDPRWVCLVLGLRLFPLHGSESNPHWVGLSGLQNYTCKCSSWTLVRRKDERHTVWNHVYTSQNENFKEEVLCGWLASLNWVLLQRTYYIVSCETRVYSWNTPCASSLWTCCQTCQIDSVYGYIFACM